MGFAKATKTAARLRLAIAGPAGGGKTFTALRIATALGKRVALIDTERGSASKYAPAEGEVANPAKGTFDFEAQELRTFEPKHYVAAIHEAEREGFDVLVIDSLSHAWSGTGGILDQLDKKGGGNKFDAWRALTPQQNALVEAILQSPIHIITTMRSKTDYVVDKDEKTGKATPRKVGLAPVQRGEIEYEFDVVLEMSPEHVATVSKTRCSDLAEQTFRHPGADVAAILKAWLGEGPVPPRAQATTAAEPAAETDWPARIQAAASFEKPGKALLQVGVELGAATLNGRREVVLSLYAAALEKYAGTLPSVEAVNGFGDAFDAKLSEDVLKVIQPRVHAALIARGKTLGG